MQSKSPESPDRHLNAQIIYSLNQNKHALRERQTHYLLRFIVAEAIVWVGVSDRSSISTFRTYFCFAEFF
jgi:hypothetical protein